MTNREFVSRVANQLRMLSKDDYVSDRLILSTGISISKKLLTQQLNGRSLNRNSFVFKEITCIEFKDIDKFTCPYVEFKSCKHLSKSVKSIKDIDLIYGRYGSSVKELYSIDNLSQSLTQSTLYQLRNDSKRQGYEQKANKFYVLDGHIYVPARVRTLSALILGMDQYEMDKVSNCSEGCKSAWEYDFIASDNVLDDVISYTVQQLSLTKQIPEDESANLSNSAK